MSSLVPETHFAQGASGAGAVYDNSPSGLGLTPSYLAGGATASATGGGGGGGGTTGIVSAFAGSAAPSGFVLCDGSTYDGTNPLYAALYAVIGITYGGSGISAFQVPDIRGRVVVAKGTNALVNALGNNDGVAVANRRPKHRHTAHTHTVPTSNNAGSSQIIHGDTDRSVDIISSTTSSVDGGSGTSTDSLDAPAYLVLNYLIAL